MHPSAQAGPWLGRSDSKASIFSFHFPPSLSNVRPILPLRGCRKM